MANIFFNGDKMSKQEAINTLTLEISNYFGGRYEVKTGSDDGGSVLEVFVEVPTPSLAILEQCPDFPLYEVVPSLSPMIASGLSYWLTCSRCLSVGTL